MTTLFNAAGTSKTIESAQAVLDTGSDSVVLGSFSVARREGNPGIVDYFGPSFSLNVRGIPSPPIDEWVAIVRLVADRAHAIGKRIGVSVAAFDPTEYGLLSDAAFASGADFVELNFGCPNMQEGGTFAPVMSYRPDTVEEILRSLPDGEMWAKVSPIFDDALFAALAATLRHQKITGVVAINTLPQCLALDDDGSPVLSFGSGVGGMAGPAIKPIALAQSARWVCEGFRTIGVGGITSGRDLGDFQKVGVEACQVNTVLQREGASALDRIAKEAS